MGTKVQHKMYLSGYYPMRDLKDSNSNGSWPSHHENKNFGQYYGIFSARPTIDGYIDNDKEQLRQTIIKHETVFRQQLHELHRLYKKQTDMMNEVRSRAPQKHFRSKETSQSSFFPFPSLDDKNRGYGSSLPLVDFSHQTPSPSGADSMQSHLSSVDVKIMQSGCGSTLNRSRSKEYESLEFKCKKLQRRLFDLELPAEEYINDEEEGQGASGGTGVDTCPQIRYCEVISKKNGNLSTHSGAYSICNGDASSSNVKRNVGFTDLNEPVQVEEASGTASVDILGSITCSGDGIRRIDLSASNCSGFLAKETSQIAPKVKDEGVSLCDLNLETEQKQKSWLPSPFNPGQKLPAICESAQVGYQKPHDHDQNRKEQATRKTIFGVEISVRNYDTSVIEAHTSQPLVPQSNVANSESSSISSWNKLPCIWRPDLIHGTPCLNAFPKSENGSVTLLHGHEVTWDGSLTNNNMGSVPILRAETSCKDGPCIVSPLQSKQSQVCHGSVGFGYMNGISDSNSTSEQVAQHSPTNNIRGSAWFGNSKSIEEANAVIPKECKNGANSDSKMISVDGPKEEENPKGGLSWLREISFCNGKYSKERDGSHLVDLNFLENHSQQFSIKIETTKSPSQSLVKDSLVSVQYAEGRRTEGGDCSSNRKIIGIPIFEKQMSKDLPSGSSASKPSLASEINGATANPTKAGFLLADLNHDPIPSESGEIQPSKSENEEKANLRDCIDLNVCVTEEETQLTNCSPRTRVKIALEIDLEAPVVLDAEIDITSGGEFAESKLKESVDSLKDESGDSYEGLMKVAAEALIAISSYGRHNIQGDSTWPQVEASSSDSLQWFAQIITSYKVEIEKDVALVSIDEDSADRGDAIPDGIDYFEYMTLNLAETNFEEYHYEPQVIENAKDEVTLSRRPRRGQARRGRQRKDFQRDVLPGLVSLSRNDVAEDLQTIEGLIRATGGIWQSSLSQRNSPKGKGGRGRKRSAASAASPTVTTVSPPPQAQQLNCVEMTLGETRLTGWGKRTRRPPRQRCPINNPLPVQ